MEITFDSTELRSICEDDGEAYKLYGFQFSVSLKALLADMWASDFVVELPFRELVEMQIGESAFYRVEVCEGHSLDFVSGHVKTPFHPSGKIDLTKVRRVKITAIN